MDAGRYVILATLGQDPTGTTFLALEPELEQRVVLKRFVPTLAKDQAFLSGFRQEARLMSLFDHPNVVHVLEFFAEEEAVVVSEYVRGVSLRAVVEVGGRMTPVQALAAVKGTLAGVAYAHDLGLIHRDIRPENVLADTDGRPRLTAFGQTTKTLSRTGARDLPGRIAAYASPERLAGSPVGVRADVYSCGALLYKLLTGEAPYTAENLNSVLRQLSDDPVPDPRLLVPSLPDAVAELTVRALARAPEERPESADLFLQELESAAATAYGALWEQASSIKRIVGSAAAALAGDMALDDAVQSIESMQVADPSSVSRPRAYAGVAVAVSVLFASVAGLAYVKGLIGTQPGAAAVGSPAAEAVTTPSPLPTPSPAPSPVPSAAPVVRPPVRSPGPVIFSASALSVSFAPCFSARDCGSAVDGAVYTADRPFDASGYPAIELMDTFNWSFANNGDEPQEVVVTWLATGGAGNEYPPHTVRRTLHPPSGRQNADLGSGDLVQAAPAPSTNSAFFDLSWTDSAGAHHLVSRTFYWRR